MESGLVRSRGSAIGKDTRWNSIISGPGRATQWELGSAPPRSPHDYHKKELIAA